MLKRLIDISVSIMALICLSPLVMSIALLIRWRMGAPIMFCQERPGKGGESFIFYKFRTMLNLTGVDDSFPNDAQRLTRLGKLLRKLSLDELPQFYNVLRGDMSLVGPRPLLMEYLPLYSPEQARRHDVKPGITGWAQIHGRNNLDWDEKFILDVWYVDHQRFLLDLKILFLTIVKVFSGEGVNKEGYATTNYFRGSSKDEQDS